MLARGLKYEEGSVEDTFARMSIEHERKTEFAKTMVIVNAIIGMGNHIAMSVSGGNSDKKVLDGLNNSITTLKRLLIPESIEQTESEAMRVKNILKKEMEQGPISITPIGTFKNKKGKIRLKQK